MPVFAAPFSYLLHLRRRRLPSVLSLGLQPPVPASGPRVALVVGEPEEVEGLPGAFFPHGRRGKVEEPGLPGVQRESVFSKALARHLIHALGIALVAEAEQGVVRIMDEPHPASQHGLHIFTLWRHAATDLGSLTPRSLLECCSISWLDSMAAFCPLSTLHAALPNDYARLASSFCAITCQVGFGPTGLGWTISSASPLTAGGGAG